MDWSVEVFLLFSVTVSWLYARIKSDLGIHETGGFYWMNSESDEEENMCTTVNHLWHVHRSRVVTLFWGVMTLGGARRRFVGSFWGLWPFRCMTTTILPPRRQFDRYDVQSNFVVCRVSQARTRVAKTKFPEGQNLSTIRDINMVKHSFW